MPTLRFQLSMIGTPVGFRSPMLSGEAAARKGQSAEQIADIVVVAITH
jgi:hypothetical protein